jgi:ATP-dependent Clp protease ATP-binding subunit ClpB
VALKWTKEVVDRLAEEGYDPFFGARPLKRLIQQEVVNMLSKAILEGKIPPESTVELKYEKGAYSFDVKKK